MSRYKQVNFDENVSLQKLNTFGIDVTARYFIKIEHETDLLSILDDHNINQIDRKLILGEGSNILFVDDFFNGLVIHMQLKGFEIVLNDEINNKVMLKVGAGERWVDVIDYTMRHRLRGLEHLAGIPGTMGAAPVQNISAYGSQLSDMFVECQVFDTQNKRFLTFDKHHCRFAYRRSIFKESNSNNIHTRYIITHVTVALSKSLSESTDSLSQNIVNEVLEHRSSKLPNPWSDVGNAGSFFLNPTVSNGEYKIIQQREEHDIPHRLLHDNQVQLMAGWLIEKCHWKGKTLSTAGTWHRQANVLINNGSTKGNDLWTLAKEICVSVQQNFHIRLETEVNIIRVFKPIRNILSSKLIIRKSHSWADEIKLKMISIPPDKNACVHLLFAAVSLQQTVCFQRGFYEHMSYDVMRILQWIDEYHVGNMYFHGDESLKIVPNPCKLIDITSASFSRASIGIAGSTLLKYGSVRCVELGGCQFTARPIDLHRKLLIALGGYSDDGEIYCLKRNWEHCDDDFEFDCRSTGGVSSVGLTIHAILSCCALPEHIRCKLTHVAIEPSVRSVITLTSQYRVVILNETTRTITFGNKFSLANPNLVVEHIPIDQIYLFTVCSLTVMLQFKVSIRNFEYDECISEYLKTIVSMITIDDDPSVLLVDGQQSFMHNEAEIRKIVCDVYPRGLPTDVSPIITALFIARNVSFELEDYIYDKRNKQCEEFAKLGYETVIEGNRIIYHRNSVECESQCHDLFAHDIRSGVAVLLMALFNINKRQLNRNDSITIHQYEQIQRGYGDLLHQKLAEFGFDVQLVYN